ncbi:hypothetical protein [uncultured Aquimarina sp.]|uniref:hypothetical protein n=1 Tax=uncultured Aquimarina sp. TaxID=575652 RepID=UPI0026286D08|nr:hypothetical protein [uncultured Aquimarina sp.]
MKNVIKIFYFGLSITCFNCGLGEWDVTLYEQKIEGTSKVIYEYDAWGGRDSHSSGIVIIDSTKKFQVNSSKKIPISYFTEITNKTRIKAVKLKKAINNDSISLNPLKKENIEIKDISLEIEHYEQYNGYSDLGCILNTYSFQTFKETKDSLFLYGLKKEFGNNLAGKTSIGFKKGNIKLITDSIGKLNRLEIKELIIKRGNKRKYKKGTAEITERIKNSPVVCLRRYHFKPLIEINRDDFTDYGIFKRK